MRTVAPCFLVAQSLAAFAKFCGFVFASAHARILSVVLLPQYRAAHVHLAFAAVLSCMRTVPSCFLVAQSLAVLAKFCGFVFAGDPS